MTEEIIESLKNGGVGIMPTDTIYGVACSALSQAAVERVYEIKGRDAGKPVIVLVATTEQLRQCGVEADSSIQQTLLGQWRAAPTSIIIPADDTLHYIHRGVGTVAVRMPCSNPQLMRDIAKVGPIIATSANISGESYVNDFDHIRTRLPGLDFYMKGLTSSVPSQLATLDTEGNLKKISR